MCTEETAYGNGTTAVSEMLLPAMRLYIYSCLQSVHLQYGLIVPLLTGSPALAAGATQVDSYCLPSISKVSYCQTDYTQIAHRNQGHSRTSTFVLPTVPGVVEGNRSLGAARYLGSSGRHASRPALAPFLSSFP